MRLTLLLLALTLTATAQHAPRKVKIKRAKAATKAMSRQTAPVLIFQRTPCHGTCPTYTATIFADGRVEYVGERFVTRLGQHTLRLPAAQVTELLAAAQKAGFDKFDDKYVADISDLPSTLITVQAPGRPAKAVEVRGDAPAALQAYIDFLKLRLDPLSSLTEER